jgi:putative membrane protein
MQEFLILNYEWIRALHIIAVISWMAGMLYLPRLFVYHADVAAGSEISEKFKIMEHRLLRYITNPAMIASFIFGGLMLWANPDLLSAGWMHVKLAAIFLMSAMHGMFARWRKDFAADKNTKSSKFFRFANEGPTILMILIVIMAVVQSF